MPRLTPKEIGQELSRQIDCLASTGLYSFLGMNRKQYVAQLHRLAKKFRWDSNLSKLGLQDVAIFDERLGIGPLADAGKVSNCEKHRTLNKNGDVVIVQVDWGNLYSNQGPFPNLPGAIMPFSAQEALHAFVYWPIANDDWWVDSRSPKANKCTTFWCSRSLYKDGTTPAHLITGIWDWDDGAGLYYGGHCTDPSELDGVPVRGRAQISLKNRKHTRRPASRRASPQKINYID